MGINKPRQHNVVLELTIHATGASDDQWLQAFLGPNRYDLAVLHRDRRGNG
jgi:hypothetical protein